MRPRKAFPTTYFKPYRAPLTADDIVCAVESGDVKTVADALAVDKTIPAREVLSAIRSAIDSGRVHGDADGRLLRPETPAPTLEGLRKRFREK